MSKFTQLWSPVLMLVLLALFARQAHGQADVDVLRTRLKSDKFTIELREERSALIKELIAILADEKADREVRIRAVEILGAIRASEAVHTLIEHIDKIQPETIDEKTIETLYPCVPALIKIGKPSAREALQELRQPMKDVRRLAIVVVLGGVEGRKLGRLLLEDEIAGAKTAQERQNLQEGLEAFLAMTANER